MAIKYNKSTLKKIEEIFKNAGFILRYERGQFRSGYCILRDKRIIIINRFFETKARVEILTELILQVELDESTMNDQSKQILKAIEKSYSERVN